MAAVVSVFVDGFDFDTSAEALEAHMSQVGTVVSVQKKKGNAVVTYSSPKEAKNAEAQLSKSTIGGNSRYIEVWLDKKALPPKPGMKRKFEGADGSEGGSTKVLVRGFDFETSGEQIAAHMSNVGSVEELHFVDSGSVNVIYSTPSEATAAVATLHGSTIPGNSRYLDIIIGGDRAADNFAKRFKGGGSSWGKPKGGGKGKGWRDHSDEDPAGSGRVFVQGFDYDTTNEQLERHMSKAGPIHTIHFVNGGSAVVVYKKKAGADKACASLENTTIPGNSRYINVKPRQ